MERAAHSIRLHMTLKKGEISGFFKHLYTYVLSPQKKVVPQNLNVGYLNLKQARCDPDAIGANNHFMDGCVSSHTNFNSNRWRRLIFKWIKAGYDNLPPPLRHNRVNYVKSYFRPRWCCFICLVLYNAFKLFQPLSIILCICCLTILRFKYSLCLQWDPFVFKQTNEFWVFRSITFS